MAIHLLSPARHLEPNSLTFQRFEAEEDDYPRLRERGDEYYPRRRIIVYSLISIPMRRRWIWRTSHNGSLEVRLIA